MKNSKNNNQSDDSTTTGWGRIPNPPSSFQLTEDSGKKMREALDRHVAVSKKQWNSIDKSKI
jgi:hypothetical protein